MKYDAAEQILIRAVHRLRIKLHSLKHWEWSTPMSFEERQHKVECLERHIEMAVKALDECQRHKQQDSA